MIDRKPYAGTTRILVLGIDVGTTYSGISYSILDPGQVPEIKHVTRFPAQDRAGADSKIPSIMYYDQKGVARAFGAEALDEGVIDQAYQEDWTKVEWFKLFLAKSESVHQKLKPLPSGKTPTLVFADFLGYLFRCAEKYIRETHHNGDTLWEGVQAGQVHFVLTHPNAWEGIQQSQLRDAAVKAGLISSNPAGQSRLQFVTEGEASLHFCLQQGLGQSMSKSEKGTLIIDAGGIAVVILVWVAAADKPTGGTIDISVYAPTSIANKIGFEEIATPHCLSFLNYSLLHVVPTIFPGQFNGSVFVTLEAKRALAEKLNKSKFADDLDEIIRRFDSSTKIMFRNPKEPSFIRFGRPKDNEAAYGIRNGQLRLSGDEVASFFEPSVQSIIDAVTSIGFDASNSVSRAFLVGGFAASDHLYNSLKAHFDPLGIQIVRPDAHINKAVSDGAIGYHIDHQVSVRVARATYGVRISQYFNSQLSSHQRRLHKAYTDSAGDRMVPDGFALILRKNTKVSETQEFQTSVMYSLDSTDTTCSTKIQQYNGATESVDWMDEEEDKFVSLCSISMDRATVRRIAKLQTHTSHRHWRVDCDILLSFGLTELKAQFVWKENGVEQRSPAALVYPDNKPNVVYSKFQ
ncbi:hypothetical protein DL96DRAFT_1824045 [Flagelloscypha sp. PMI_526]|nr:hypothetical protein DL96DRAFT_1824045 [Flagelloscypha sp. PMI_526]